MKTALIITYYWPPSGGSGVQRWMYFAMYMQEFGIRPIVLTVDSKKASYKNFDYTLLENVKNIETHTTSTFEPLKLYSLIKGGDTRSAIPQGSIRGGVANKLFRFIRGNFFIPDARIGWKRFAIKKAKEIFRKSKIDCIITTGPPHSTHLIGKKLKEIYGTKWLVDFRDPWSEVFYNKDLIRTSWAAKKDRRLEIEVLQKADLVLTVGPSMKKLLADKVSHQNGKFHFIYNGYDHKLMEEAEVIEDNYFKIIFIGLLSSNQPHQGLIKALLAFFEKHKASAADIKIIFVGNIEELALNELKKLGHVFEHMSGVAHKEALMMMKNGSLLLNCLAESEHTSATISGKMMEYFASENPILSVGNPSGDAAKLMKDIAYAKMYDKSDIGKMEEFIKLVFENWESNQPLKNNNTNIQRFSRYETSRQMADLLNRFSC